MNNTWKSQCKYPAGTVIIGKWNRHRYEIVRMLGSGANGVVYLAESSFGLTAIKISIDSVSIISEVNVLNRAPVRSLNHWNTTNANDERFALAA